MENRAFGGAFPGMFNIPHSTLHILPPRPLDYYPRSVNMTLVSPTRYFCFYLFVFINFTLGSKGFAGFSCVNL